MRYPKVRELAEAVKALIRGPYTSRFPAEPHEPCRNFRGQPRFDESKCVGCLACEEVCPVEAIAHRDETGTDAEPRRVMVHYTDTCIFCGQCEAACIANHEGIQLSREWELSFFDRSSSFETIEKALVLCECCGEPIACRDHLKWIASRLGELTFSNPTLYLAHLQGLGVVDEAVLETAGDLVRADRVRILCARCRRRTTRHSD